MRKLAVVTLAIALSACGSKNDTSDDALTLAEARQALDESNASAEASSLASSAVEIGTNFTIGGAVAKAAQDLRDFVGSQLPCADVSLKDATLAIEYGVKPGNCTWHGNTFTGKTSLTVKANDMGQVVVEHVWDGLSNGRIALDGHATVTWDVANPSRHVVHEATWTRLADGLTATGAGDRTEKPLEGGVAVGFREDGSRSWTGAHGAWDLGISGVEMRWIDPVPQAGTYTLRTPSGKALTTTFTRKDADTITVKIASGAHAFSFDVNALGIPEH